MPQAPFHGWRVVRAAFVVAVFGWGVGFYGPPVFLHAVHESRGWPVPLISAAITAHFLFGAFVTANLAALHRRFGLAVVTRAAALSAAIGLLGWALAREPWQLFAAALLTGAGWSATSGAAINAIVAPWFVRRRPAALSTAYNGASVGGVVLSPLWVVLIAGLGFPGAAAVVGTAMVLALWFLTARIIGPGPADLGQHPDGEAAPGPARPAPASRPGGSLWRSRAFATLAVATSLSLFAQIGLIAHLYSLLVPALGEQGAGFAAGLATACAIAGRTGLGWLLPEGADRRRAGAANATVQVAGSLVLLAAAGASAPLLLLGVVLFGLGLGNATSLPPLIAQRDFALADTARVVALVTACSQAAYAFAPAAFGLLRDLGPAPIFVAAAALQAAAALVLLAGRPAPAAAGLDGRTPAGPSRGG
ncbi:MFS transporter [Roseomonas sp. CCTCC AB2023176]|uniref:MFS transporter n=1 Tax=Roseomonas sp. CCTCC AB2023176 TaxID=3342640 RepID=UPI0035DB7BC2